MENYILFSTFENNTMENDTVQEHTTTGDWIVDNDLSLEWNM